MINIHHWTKCFDKEGNYDKNKCPLIHLIADLIMYLHTHKRIYYVDSYIYFNTMAYKQSILTFIKTIENLKIDKMHIICTTEIILSVLLISVQFRSPYTWH